MSFSVSFHQALLSPSGAHWLDDPSDLTCKETTRQHAVDDPLLSCNPLLATWGHGSPPASPPCVTRWNIWCPVHGGGDGPSGRGAPHLTAWSSV